MLIADWKLTPAAVKKISNNANHTRLTKETTTLLDACAKYYQTGVFPDELISSTPPLVTSEPTPKAMAAQQQAIDEQRAQDERFYQNQVAQNWGMLGAR